MKTLKRLNPWILFLLFLSVPTAWGQPANFTLDFETGSLRGWQKTGNAFNYQPTLNDNPTARHRGQPSRHQGRYWIGTYERYQGFRGQKPGDSQGDGPTGRLTSAPFTISHDYLKFLIGGGNGRGTRVELLVLDPIEQTYVPRESASGKNTETMHRVVWNISRFQGKRAKLRIVDDSSGAWGHINADDFRFEVKKSTQNPPVKPRIVPGFLTVRRGETAVFRSSLGPDHEASIPQNWSGPDGQHAQGPVFRIETPRLVPGTYKVFLRIGNLNFSTAYFPVEAQASLRILPPAIKYRLRLQVQPIQVEEKELVTLTAVLNPPSPEAEYKFDFGDGKVSGWMTGSSRHQYRLPGQYTATVYARPGNDEMLESNKVLVKVVPRSYELHIRADRTRAKTGDVLRFSGRLLPETPGVRYRFFLGDGQKSPLLDQPGVRHRFEREGQFLVFCEAYVGNRTVKSNRIQISVQREKFEINLEVFPGQISAERGEVVRFKGTALPESAEDLEMKWSGPRGQGETGEYFDVETSSLDPGTYQVTLRVTDRFGRSARAQARLKVVPVTRSISLRVNPEKVQQGQSVELEASIEPEVSDAEYNFHFGDDSSSGWLSIAGTSHKYAHPGRYCSYVEAGLPGGETVKSEQTCLEVTGKRVPKLVLKAEPAQAKPGQEILFRARLEPSIPGVQYKFIFGDKQTRDWGKEAAASHKYAQEGTYRVKVLAREEDIGDIESRELLLKVEKSNLLFWIIGILFAGSYGLYRMRQGSKNDKKGGGKLSVVKIRANRDPGVQTVYCRDELKAGTEIKIRPVSDQGRQEISGEIPLTSDEKGEIQS